MFSFFKKKPIAPSTFSALHTDMHSHLIPGIDDGAPDVETALALVEALVQLGYRRIITTPHVMADLYPNTPEIIQEGLEKLQNAITAAGLDIEIAVAAEYLMDEAFGAKIENKSLLTLPGNRVLVEMSFVSPAPEMDNYLFQLQLKGYRPIMAHPERYLYLKGDLKTYERLKDQGCALQVNILSLHGYYGSPVKDIAWKLIKHKMVDYLGTDLHHHKHAQQLKNAVANPKIARLLHEYSFANARL
ncbi:MAG: CpsB/CapC family capsule biosynthesis tyrosine phosphatase [Saprospiraceae bacterium]